MKDDVLPCFGYYKNVHDTGEIVFSAYWCEDIDSYKVGGWESCIYCVGASMLSLCKKDYTTNKITHWMPLPKPPNSRDEL